MTPSFIFTYLALNKIKNVILRYETTLLLFNFLLTFSLPVFAQGYLELNGTTSHMKGPNCWNGALVAANVLDSKRFIHSDEWLIHLKRNCYQVNLPKMGDIGRIFYQGPASLEEEEAHGFIHLDNQNIFAKHSMYTVDGYQIMSYNKMFYQYARTQSCTQSNNIAPECYNKMIYYRCTQEAKLPAIIKRINKYLRN